MSCPKTVKAEVPASVCGCAYAQRDWQIVDYQPFQLPGTGLWFRGPAPSLAPGNYIACVGAAQTFGCFVDEPFPSLLQHRLEVPVLNLGFGGAGPTLYSENEVLMKYINAARLVIVQVMSGRSASNSRYRSDGGEHLIRRATGERIGARAAWREVLEEQARISVNFGKARDVFLFPRDRRVIDELVAETRDDWVLNMTQLAERIRAPKFLFYFSKRRPGAMSGYLNVHTLLRGFPQLVTERMLRELSPHFDGYVECVSRKGWPHLLFDRFTGRLTGVEMGVVRRDQSAKWWYDRYYPTPAMHRDAADSLERACRAVLDA